MYRITENLGLKGKLNDQAATAKDLDWWSFLSAAVNDCVRCSLRRGLKQNRAEQVGAMAAQLLMDDYRHCSGHYVTSTAIEDRVRDAIRKHRRQPEWKSQSWIDGSDSSAELFDEVDTDDELDLFNAMRQFLRLSYRLWTYHDLYMPRDIASERKPSSSGTRRNKDGSLGRLAQRVWLDGASQSNLNNGKLRLRLAALDHQLACAWSESLLPRPGVEELISRLRRARLSPLDSETAGQCLVRVLSDDPDTLAAASNDSTGEYPEIADALCRITEIISARPEMTPALADGFDVFCRLHRLNRNESEEVSDKRVIRLITWLDGLKPDNPKIERTVSEAIDRILECSIQRGTEPPPTEPKSGRSNADTDVWHRAARQNRKWLQDVLSRSLLKGTEPHAVCGTRSNWDAGSPLGPESTESIIVQALIKSSFAEIPFQTFDELRSAIWRYGCGWCLPTLPARLVGQVQSRLHEWASWINSQPDADTDNPWFDFGLLWEIPGELQSNGVRIAAAVEFIDTWLTDGLNDDSDVPEKCRLPVQSALFSLFIDELSRRMRWLYEARKDGRLPEPDDSADGEDYPTD